MAFAVTATRLANGGGATATADIASLTTGQGNGLVLFVHTAGVTVTTPTGYTLEGSSTSASPFVYIFSKTAIANEPDQVLTLSGSARATVITLKITGQWGSSFFDTAPSFSRNSGTTTLISPTITPTNAGCLVVSVATDNGTITYTAKPASMTLASQGINSTLWGGAAYLTHTTGATGTFSWTFSAGGGNDATATFAIRAAATTSTDTTGGRGDAAFVIKKHTSRRLKQSRTIPNFPATKWSGRENNPLAAVLFKAKFTRQKWRLQRQTAPAGAFALDPRKLTPKVDLPPPPIYKAQARKLKTPPWVPVTTARTLSAAGYPAWQSKQTKFAFNEKLQRVVHNVYPQTPAVSAQPPSAFKTHFEPTQNRTHHRRLRVAQPPATPLKASAAVWPSFKVPPTLKSKFDISRRFLTTPADTRTALTATSNSSPVVPFAVFKQRSRKLKTVPFPLGAAPNTPPVPATPATIKTWRANWIAFKTRLQVSPTHDEYPQPVFVPVVTAAIFAPKTTLTRQTEAYYVTYTAIIVDTLSAATYGAFVTRAPLTRHGNRKFLDVVSLGYFLPRTPTPEQAVSAFTPDLPVKVVYQRRLRTVPLLSYFKVSPVSVAAWTKPKSLISEQKRRLLVARPLSVFTPTPPRPFTYAALIKNVVHRRSGYLAIRANPPLGHYHEAPDINGLAARSGFLPRHNYLQGEITQVVYLETELTSGVYLLTVFKDV